MNLAQLADVAEASESRVKELEAQAKDHKAEQVFRISELQELGEAQARITELEAAEARLKVLEAQVASIGVINPAGAAKLDERPDDSESDQLIAEADSFVDAIWEIGEKYEVPLTNNMERWQEGVFLRHAGDFAADVSDAAQRFIAKPLEARIAELEAATRVPVNGEPNDDREMLHKCLDALPGSDWIMAYEYGDLSGIIDALLTAGFPRATVPDAATAALKRDAAVLELRNRYGQSNGTQTWIEFQGDPHFIVNQVLAALDGAPEPEVKP